MKIILTSGDIPYNLGVGRGTARSGVGTLSGALGACWAFVESPSEALLPHVLAAGAATAAGGLAAHKQQM